MVEVIEMAEGEECSEFRCYVSHPEHAGHPFLPVDGWYRRHLCETDDSKACTKSLRLVSESKTAVHPRDWQ